MKKIYITTALLFFISSFCLAQIPGNKVLLDDITVVKDGEHVNVSFTASVGKKAVRRSHMLTLSPVLSDGHYSVSLPGLVVMGKGYKSSMTRHEWAGGASVICDDAVYAKNGEVVRYSTLIPSQDWMGDARLSIESLSSGCCAEYRYADVFLLRGVAGWDFNKCEPELAIPLENTTPEPEVKSAEAILCETFPFIALSSEYNHNEPFKLYDNDKRSALFVNFRSGIYDIDSSYMDNSRVLDDMISAIVALRDTEGLVIDKIIVGGFSSPEGGYELNSRLAFERAVSVREYIMNRTGIEGSIIKIYNGSEDWRGLRTMVLASEMPEKDRVIDIIDNLPIWDSRGNRGRLGELMRLNGGKTYRHIYNEYFPYLRSGSLIKVFYSK